MTEKRNPAPFVPMTAADRQHMLDVVGVNAVDDLFADIPAEFRDPDLGLPPALSEHDVVTHMGHLSAMNVSADAAPSFLGGGFARHYVPNAVGAIISRGEFLTPYTPYQPEASQGILQALFEFQTIVCELTGMDAANTGMYDGASGLAEAALMACRLTRRRTVAVHESVSPLYRAALETYAGAQEITVVDGIDDAPEGELACLIIQQPAYDGLIDDDPGALADAIHERGGLLVVAVEPVSLALIRPPGEYGADIVVAEGQPLGIALGFGGPGVGFFACKNEYLRQMPGRIVGRSVDADGRDAFVLTLQTREQHIRREKATSNICTAETLAAIAVAVHTAALGPHGLREVAFSCYQATHSAARRIARLPGFSIHGGEDALFIKEFVVACPIPPADVNLRLWEQHGIIGGIDVSDRVPNGLLLCITETSTTTDIDRLVSALAGIVDVSAEADGEGEATSISDWPAIETAAAGDGLILAIGDTNEKRVPLLLDVSRPARRGVTTPVPAVAPIAPPLPESTLRQQLLLPEISELDVVRYFTRISQSNYAVDTTFYPLGSCTMKYNPRVNETVAGMPGFANAHPYLPPEVSAGTLGALYSLQEMLASVVGMDATSLAPSAGAHGELTGMLLFRAYHRSRNDSGRTVVLSPDSSHGTNPASAAMAGFNLVTVPTDAVGNVDMEALQPLLGPEVAGIMLTMPTTLGLFDPNTAEICRLIHEAGGLVYGDGANLNALLGRARLGDMGFDIVHINVHKTFSTPHGGGGPGAGPVCVKEHLAEFLPTPHIERRDDGMLHLAAPAQSVGRIGSAAGNVGVLLRAYTYFRMHGEDGLREVSGAAVLNANYIRARLKDHYHLQYDRICMHEAVFSATRQRRQHDVRAGDICKRLLDHGFYAPTVYFPLIVEEALMIEPTETESRETLDAFIDAMVSIAQEASDDPEMVRGAPHNTPVRRIDEALAARRPVLRWMERD
ncbi:MAG: aminomethyl-transferring glycine dehydrogenase subunit GcvPB [Chloroflexi bacterium]|nr:aminomethyl-transferring glycine dehydrogenase subunit GcvPB [Chloroflexota bacterium]